MYRVYILLALTFMFFSHLILTFEQHDYILKHEIGMIEYYNRSFYEYLRVKNVKPNRTFRGYSFSFHILRDLDGDTLKVNLKGYKFVNNLFNHKIFDFDVNVCEAWRKNYLGMKESFLKPGNLTMCPMKKGYYAVRNCNLNDRKLPPLLPAGRYRLCITVLYNGYNTANGSIYMEIIYKVKH